jgi:stearoyl-CoA desaturase (delta-9 desaturase)
VEYLYGLLDLSLTGYIVVTLVMMHVAVLAVTLYLHRDQAHRSIDLHPVLRHFFRAWIFMSSGMLTREWVAIHRKHHACCERPGDPHSPRVFGLRRVLLQGAELYREEAGVGETLEKYGRGTPDDWLERNVYERYPYLGIYAMLAIDLVLMGLPGLTVFALQMITMPVFAAGVINGLGHHTGYRNFESDDASTNITPVAFILGGEELHNNHHAFPTSAKFSSRSWEFDLGWALICLFRFFGLCKVRRVAPTPKVASTPRHVDMDTLRAVIENRMHVLRDYTRRVTLPVLKHERRASGDRGMLRKVRKLVVRRPALLDDAARERLAAVLSSNQALRTVHEYRDRLQAIWEQANVSNEKLLGQLRDWCAAAEASGIDALEEFAQQLRGYVPQHSN